MSFSIDTILNFCVVIFQKGWKNLTIKDAEGKSNERAYQKRFDPWER